jgi:hypothetical protein
MRKIATALIFIGISLFHLKAQTLPPGAVAFVGFQSDQPISFAFVNLVDLEPNTSISFTDNKWGFDHLVTSEQTVIWTSPDTMLPVGTIVKLQDNGSENMQVIGAGSTVGRLYIMGGQGDQILAYTGAEEDPSFIAGISNSNWQPTCDSLTFFQFRTCLPEPLENGVTAVSFTNTQSFNVDNGYFSISPFQATGLDMLAIINNVNYWFMDNAGAGGYGNWPNWESGSTQPFPSLIEFTQGSYSILEGGSQATITLSLSAAQFTPQTVVINAIGFPGITSTDYSTVPGLINNNITIDIPANTTEVSFSVQALLDGFGELNENITFTIGAISGGLIPGDQDNTQVTIVNTDQTFSQINFDSDTLFITEGAGPITLGLTISPPAAALYSVVVTAFNGPSVQTDYLTSPALGNNQILLQSAINQTSLSFNLNTFNDFLIEADEVVRFTITTVSTGLQIGNTSSVVVIIRDNDNEPTVYIPELFLNEICSTNNSFPDENNQLDDWIELYNADTSTVNIAGYKITNNLSNPSLFTFPPVSSQTTMAPGSFKILWADQNTTQGALHMNFTLNETSGGTIGLFAQDGETLIDQINYPALLPGTTFGRYLDGNSNWKLLFYPTPGAPNSDSIPDVGLKPGLETSDGLYSVFPNPATDQLQILKIGEHLDQKINFQLFDLQGKICETFFTERVVGKHWILNTNNLISGVYTIRITAAKSQSLVRFIKL